MAARTPPGKIRKAITEKTVVTFHYANLYRKCEVHVYGVTNGRDQILCWQLDGESQRGGIPEWRRFDLGDVVGLKLTNETHPGYRPVPYPHSLWDQVILTV